MKANEILAIGNEIFRPTKEKVSTKRNLCRMQNRQRKKNLRMKLRKKLDTFIAEFIASNKNIEKGKH